MDRKESPSPGDDGTPRADSGASWRILWALLAAALAWGVILAVGALRKDTLRGLIVLGFAALFALFWAWMLVRFARKRS